MGDKGEFKGVFDKYKPMLKKFGNDMSEAARKGEENVSKMSRMVKIQLDMLAIAVRKERLYYEIGKDVAGMLSREGVDIPKLDKYKKKLEDMAHETDKKKREMVRVSALGNKVKKNK